MSRRTTTILAFVVAVILTVLGTHYCNHKVVPLVRLALWFPLPHLLHASGIPGVLLAWLQFPLLACLFAFAIRRWPASWVLAAFVTAYGMYAAVVLVRLGPPR